MSTTTKKDLIDRIAEDCDLKRADVKQVVQSFLDNVIVELSQGNRLEFRDFGVFETRDRKSRMAQNPKTLAPVNVPARRTVKFKVGRLMQLALDGEVDVLNGDASVGTRRRRAEGDEAIDSGVTPTVETVRRPVGEAEPAVRPESQRNGVAGVAVEPG